MTPTPSYTRQQRQQLWQDRTARIFGTLLHILTVGTVLATTAWLATVGLEHAAYLAANPVMIGDMP